MNNRVTAWFRSIFRRPPPTCTYEIRPVRLEFTPEQTGGHLELRTQNRCTWKAGTSDKWLVVVPSNGNSSATIMVGAAENKTGAERIGIIRVGDQQVHVVQSAYGVPPPDPIPPPPEPPPPDPPPGDGVVVTLGTAKDMPPNSVGFNSNQLAIGNPNVVGLVESVRDLNPQLVRFPGGSVASVWDWQKGGVESPPFDGMPGAFTSAYAQAYVDGKVTNMGDLLSGYQVILCLNVVRDTLTSQKAFIQAAIDAGLNVAYIEVGNEIYTQKSFVTDVFPNPSDYNTLALAWVASIRADFPNIPIAVVGVNPRVAKLHPNDERVATWNDICKPCFDAADAVTLHDYQIDETSLLDGVFTQTRALQDAFTLKYKLWITEYNLRSTSMQWDNGLAAALQTLLYLEQDNIQVVNYHVLVAGTDFSAIFGDPSIVGPHLHSAWSWGSSAYCLGIISNAIIDAQSMHPLVFSQTGQYGWAFVTGDGRITTVVVNHSASDIEIARPAYYLQTPSYFQAFAEPNQVIGTVKPDIVEGALGAGLILPPYSITRINP